MNTVEIARRLDKAALEAKPTAQISLETKFSVEEAYQIQEELMVCRYERGEKLVGLKMGFTSEAKMKQMGVNDLIWGRLSDRMLIENGGNLERALFCHPRVEPELCFLIKKDITSEISLEEAPEYVEAIAPALEVIDSRYENFKFSLEDVIADNCSSSAFIVGEWQDVPAQINDLAMSMKIKGGNDQDGNSSAILGNPWKSLVHASRLAAAANQEFLAGHYLMAGAATGAEFINVGHEISLEVSGLGSVGFKVV